MKATRYVVEAISYGEPRRSLRFEFRLDERDHWDVYDDFGNLVFETLSTDEWHPARVLGESLRADLRKSDPSGYRGLEIRFVCGENDLGDVRDFGPDVLAMVWRG